jgi:hypothetical protein
LKYVKECWEDNNRTHHETHHEKIIKFLGNHKTPEILEFCSQRKNMVADPDLESEETDKYLYNYQEIIVDSEANTLYISFKNRRNELIFMGGNLNKSKSKLCEIQIIPIIESPPLLAPDVKITLTNDENKILLSAVVLKRDEAIQLVADLIKNNLIQAKDEEPMSVFNRLMTGGKIYLKNKNLKPLKKFINTTRRYVGKDKVSRVIYVKGKAEYTKRKSVVGFEYVRIRVPKPRS